jgi:ATP-dependent exoDNAse (exonuclease V) beta subunit
MTLIDDQARKDAIEMLNSSHFIEAGAGTGKSTTLVSRIIATVQREEPTIGISEIAAITFTQRAGAELRNKLREGLESACAKNPQSSKLKTALENLNSARVGTIHSLAQAILREHAISARVPLGFEVGADSDAKAAQAARSKASVEIFLAHIGQDSREVLLSYGVSVSQLRELFSEIDQNASQLTNSAFEASDTELHSAQAELLTGLEAYWLNAQELNTATNDLLYTNMTDVLPPLIELVKRANPAEMLNKWIELSQKGKVETPSLGRGGSVKNWSGNEPKEIRAEFKKFSKALAAFHFSPAIPLIRGGLSAVWQGLKAARYERLAAGALEYDDLMSLTAELLQNNQEVRRYVHNQFKVVMVDEFQDTDPLQWKIVKLITSDPHLEPEKNEHLPLPGHLVVVGDPKQAIYSFRGADIDTYISALEGFQDTETGFGDVRSLTTNFRSVSSVIEEVNKIFRVAMAPGTPRQVNYQDLDPFHNPTAPNPGPAIQVIRDPEPAPANYDPNEMESHQLAFAINRAIEDKWRVTEESDSKSREFTRGAQYSDITILYPTRTGTPALLDSLDDYAIPYRSADAGLVYSRPVIMGIKAALTTAVENQADLNLWLALKSPLFGCTDAQLMEHRLSGNSWYTSDDSQSGVVTDALRVLNRLRSRATNSTPVDLMDFLLEHTRILEYLPRTHRGNFDADCIRMVKAHAQEWQDQGGAGLYEYLQWLEAVLLNSTKTALSEPDDQQDNAVRLMTIHQAKGLEFPIVVLSGMSREMGFTEPTVGITSRDHFEFSIAADKKTPGYQSWSEHEYAPRQRAEKIRLMYVALTRAQDHLIVSLAGDSKVTNKDGTLAKKPRFSGLLIEAIPSTPADITTVPEIPIVDENEPTTPVTPLDPAWRSGIEDLQSSTKIRWVSSPSGEGAIALGLESTPIAIEDGDKTTQATIEREMRDGTAIGQSVHRSLDTLIHIPTPTAPTINDVCAQIATEEDALSHLELIVSMVNQGLTSEIVQIAISSGEFWSEMYLAAPVEHPTVKVVDGLIDLTYRDQQGGIHIIDYKTDQVLSEQAMTHYREQLMSYAELMKRATGATQITTQVLHLTKDSYQSIPIR